MSKPYEYYNYFYSLLAIEPLLYGVNYALTSSTLSVEALRLPITNNHSGRGQLYWLSTIYQSVKDSKDSYKGRIIRLVQTTIFTIQILINWGQKSKVLKINAKTSYTSNHGFSKQNFAGEKKQYHFKTWPRWVQLWPAL